MSERKRGIRKDDRWWKTMNGDAFDPSNLLTHIFLGGKAENIERSFFLDGALRKMVNQTKTKKEPHFWSKNVHFQDSSGWRPRAKMDETRQNSYIFHSFGGWTFCEQSSNWHSRWCWDLMTFSLMLGLDDFEDDAGKKLERCWYLCNYAIW